jgi:hypothetical protein
VIILEASAERQHKKDALLVGKFHGGIQNDEIYSNREIINYRIRKFQCKQFSEILCSVVFGASQKYLEANDPIRSENSLLGYDLLNILYTCCHIRYIFYLLLNVMVPLQSAHRQP